MIEINHHHYEWVIQQKEHTNFSSEQCDFFILFLLEEAVKAYCYNLPLATILCTNAAWNSFLCVKLKIQPDKKNQFPSTAHMFKEAFKVGLIGKELHSRLLRYQRTVRDPLEHSKANHPYKGLEVWKSFSDPSTLKG
ncbi:MAG: hypothetical protein ACFFFH_09670 [Candidatus Thorarchaeota archaeon]